MERKDIKEILQRIGAGTASKEEEQAGHYWLHYFQRKDIPVLSEEELNEESDAIYQALVKTYYAQREPKPLWPRFRIAAGVAAAVAAITLGTWLYPGLSSRVSRDLNHNAIQSDLTDIAPGKNTATLTLANGKTIKLSDATNGELAKEGGVTITKTKDGQLIYDLGTSEVGMTGSLSSRGMAKDPGATALGTNTLSTAKGETYVVRLPDGSKVWLNAASSLTYSASLGAAGVRRVTLQGEAYFEIFKSKTQKFVVATKNQVVEVLGTHFNINSYADEGSTKTTLLEGSVRVMSSRGTHETSSGQAVKDLGPTGLGTILKPNQQSVLTDNNRIKVANVDAQTAVAWRNGEFVFRKDDMQTVMRQIARWYDVIVVYEDSMPGKTIWGSVNRYSNISAVLEMIELTGGVHFRIEGKTVYVSKK